MGNLLLWYVCRVQKDKFPEAKWQTSGDQAFRVFLTKVELNIQAPKSLRSKQGRVMDGRMDRSIDETWLRPKSYGATEQADTFGNVQTPV